MARLAEKLGGAARPGGVFAAKFQSHNKLPPWRVPGTGVTHGNGVCAEGVERRAGRQRPNILQRESFRDENSLPAWHAHPSQ